MKVLLQRAFFLLIVLLLCTQLLVNAQTVKKINVENANSLEFDESVSSGAQRLIGDVIFYHEGTRMYCDSAWLYSKEDRLEAFSNVRIESDSVLLTGYQLNYDAGTRLSVISGNVVMTDPTTVLTTDVLNYDMANKVASYTTGGKIVSTKNDNVLTSQIGQFYSNQKMLYFKKKVRLVNPEYTVNSDTLEYHTATDIAFFLGPTVIVSKENTIYCNYGFYDTQNDISNFEKKARLVSKGQEIEGEVLYYERKSGYGRAQKFVTISDSAQKLVMKGNFAEYFEKKGEMMLTQTPSMEKVMNKDTLFLHGDTLRSYEDSATSNKKIYAYRNVRFYKQDLQGACDSLRYFDEDSIMYFYGNPVIWSEENQLSADTMYLQMANDQPDVLFMKQLAFIASENDSIRYNQIKGKSITGYFNDGELKKIVVNTNGQSIYWAEEEDSTYLGVNMAVSNDMIIYIDSSQVSSITFLGKPEATLYPIDEPAKEDLFLKGFEWLAFLRPMQKEDIFLRPVKPEVPKENQRRIK